LTFRTFGTFRTFRSRTQPRNWLTCPSPLAAAPTLTLAVALAVAPPVRAEQQLLRFDWKAPDACPTREQVLAHAEKLLGRAPEKALSEALVLSVEVSGQPGGGFQLVFSSRSATSSATRNVSAESCQELGEAAALLLALTIDPSLKAGAPGAEGAFATESDATTPTPASEPAPAKTTPPTPPATQAQAQAQASSVPPARSQRRHWLGGAELALWNRRLPGVSPGVVLHGGLSGRSWLWLLDAGFFPERHAGVAGSSAGGDLELGSLGTNVGYAFAFSSVRVTPLAGVELDWLHGSGSGVSQPGSADLLLIGFGGGARLGLSVSRSWTVYGQGQLSVLAQRPRFVLDGIGEVFRPEPWGLRFGLGAEWREP
jgi:hypothetical protein